MVCRTGKGFNGPWGAPGNVMTLEAAAGQRRMQAGREGTDLSSRNEQNAGMESLMHEAKGKTSAGCDHRSGPKGKHAARGVPRVICARKMVSNRAAAVRRRNFSEGLSKLSAEDQRWPIIVCTQRRKLQHRRRSRVEKLKRRRLEQSSGRCRSFHKLKRLIECNRADKKRRRVLAPLF